MFGIFPLKPFPYTFPLIFGDVDAVIVEDGAEAVQLHWQDHLLWSAYQHPAVFFQMEPGDQVNPAYAEAWQNQSTTLMPVFHEEDLHGLYSAGMADGSWMDLILAPPVFLPDGTRVSSPTSTKTLSARGTGRTTTTRRLSA